MSEASQLRSYRVVPFRIGPTSQPSDERGEAA